MKLGTRVVVLVSLALFSTNALAGKKKKKDAEPVVLVGWHREEGWTGDCYYPPVWDSLAQTERRMARSAAMDEMLKQWNGARNDGISFGEDLVTDVETVLLGRPEAIEQVAADNLSQCKAAMVIGGDPGAWKTWVQSLGGSLTEGECRQPLDYTMFDYLSIGEGWQRPLSICQGEKIHLSGSGKDKYRVVENGPWITVAGDPAQPATGTTLPCNVEGCLVGMLILRFQADSGWERVYPAGQHYEFEAPEHGTISYRINDDSFFDNTWFKNHGIEDHASIEVSPAP